MKKLAMNAALLLAGLAFAFALGELGVRLLLAETTALFPRYQTGYQYGPYALRGNRPGETYWHTSHDGSWKFQINSRGFRNAEEIDYPKPAGTYRVLALGDSHTHGFEVRQDATFAAVLQRALEARGRKAQVINAGVAGYGTAEQVAFLENEGLRYQPDAVVVGFFANDYEDNLKSGLFRLDEAGRLAEASKVHQPGVKIQDFIYSIPGVRFLSENSYFYSRVFNDVWVLFKMQLARARAGSRSEAADVAYAVPKDDPQSTADIELAAALLARMKAACDRAGARLVVVDIPSRVERFRPGSSMPPALRAKLDAAGIEYLPADQLFAPWVGSVELHVPHGWHHVNEFTHGIIGGELGRRLLEAPTPRAVASVPQPSM